MFVGGRARAKGAKQGVSEKQIPIASPTSKSVKNAINPSAPITGKTEQMKNRGGGEREAAQQSELVSPIHFKISSSSPLYTANY